MFPNVKWTNCLQWLVCENKKAYLLPRFLNLCVFSTWIGILYCLSTIYSTHSSSNNLSLAITFYRTFDTKTPPHGLFWGYFLAFTTAVHHPHNLVLNYMIWLIDVTHFKWHTWYYYCCWPGHTVPSKTMQLVIHSTTDEPHSYACVPRVPPFTDTLAW